MIEKNIQSHLKSILYKVRVISVTFALISSFILQAYYQFPYCAYCAAIRYAFSALMLFYVLSSFKFLVTGTQLKPKIHSMMEFSLIIVCFTLSLIAVLAKFGLVIKIFSFCGATLESGCVVSYPIYSFIDLKILSLLAASGLLVIKAVDSFLPQV